MGRFLVKLKHLPWIFPQTSPMSF
ncbi:hypothetical protein NC652_032591 [Populus alba x Populus x berolinensis]|uniref:Uncharacterized protein n=1 Tax=Populus alba x Populus x berolinensis TaxID=444605 RepID=A0AAD6PZY0_9ROSI|nr:hypothetical protein NC652_032591 [Populus alba x Populus x berolinensis]KAJ6972008.1 hypothetical protein NC653_032541 [Populus alba x Populus x berolinensis]